MPLNLTQVDLRQLQCLKVLVEERNVTKAALRLGMSQPSLSSALAKLRQVFQDPLLIRTTSGMSPTPCAIELAAEYARIKDGLESIVTNHSSFDPARSTRLFRLQANDYVIESFIAGLLGLIGSSAPNVSIKIDYISDKNFREHLESGDTDLIVGYLPISDETLHTSTLIATELCCIARRGHPRIDGQIDLENYLNEQHLALTLGRGEFPSFTDAAIDEQLARRGRTRIKAVQVPTILTMPTIIAQTDMIATLPAAFAARAAQYRPIQILPVPIPDLVLNYSMIWHMRTDKDPAHRWLRKALRSVCRQIDKK